ncbi:MAG: hypothetical protein ACREGD_04675 [Candidatus Saccharimonadales bacterium]
MKKQQHKESGLAHVAIVALVLIVIAAVAFGGWWVWERNKEDGKSSGSKNGSQTNQSGTDVEQEPKIPEGYIFYESQEFGFSFAYPEQVGSLSVSSSGSPRTLLYVRSADKENVFAPYTRSPLSVQVDKKDGFLVHGGKYGPILEFVGNKWIVSDKEDGDVLNGGYAAGSEYEAPVARTIHGTPVYDFSAGDEGCRWTAWVFETNSAFVTIALPAVCADEIDSVPEDRLAAYKEVSDQVLDTITLE